MLRFKNARPLCARCARLSIESNVVLFSLFNSGFTLSWWNCRQLRARTATPVSLRGVTLAPAWLLTSFLPFFFFFRFLEFPLESSSPKRSCQIPPKTASNNTQRIVSLYNANSRKTTRPRETSESRDSYTLPSSSVDRSILSRLQTSTRGGNPTSRAPNLFHAIPEERTARYKVCIENDKGSIRFYGRGETEFTQVFDALALSLPSRRPFSRFRASTLLPLT